MRARAAILPAQGKIEARRTVPCFKSKL